MINIINWIANIFAQLIDNIEILENIITFKEFFAILLSLFVVTYNFIKFFYLPIDNNPLNYKLSKDQLKPLKYYVTTFGQLTLPANDTNDNNERFNLMKFFMNEVFKENKYGRYFIVLGESGMGKSTFLQKLYLKYHRKMFKVHKIAFCTLTNSPDVCLWTDIKNKSNTILLLDSLDEDQKVVFNYEERIAQIINSTKEFYKVVITCRTQFFQDEQSEPKDTFLISYNTQNKKSQFYKIYISKFNDKDIDIFLNKRYKHQEEKINQAKAIIEKCSDIMARPMILSYIDELIKRPEKYSCITDIYGKLIYEWLHREPGNEKLLEQFANRVMRYMFMNNVSFITKDVIISLCKKEDIEIINPILARTRSLLNRNSKGEYRFAHKSIYEYLISYEAIYNDTSFRKKLLTSSKGFDLKFYYEMSCKFIHKDENNFNFLLLHDVNMTGIDLSGKNLVGTILSNTDLTNSNLSDANLTTAVFIDANLTNAKLDRAVLIDSNLSGATLKYTQLCFANLTNSKFTHAIITKTNFAESIIANANFTYSKLDNIDFTNTELTNSDFRYSEITGTNFNHTNLTNANFTYATLTNTVLLGAKLKNTVLKNLRLTDITVSESKIETTNIDKKALKYLRKRQAIQKM